MRAVQFSELIGKKIIAFRGVKHEKGVSLEFILFDDNETILEIREQDYYDYHDCCQSARTLNIFADPALWRRLHDKEGFEEPSDLGYHPFY